MSLKISTPFRRGTKCKLKYSIYYHRAASVIWRKMAATKMAWKKASTTAAAQPRLFACFSQISQFSFFVQKHLSPQPMLLSTYDSPWLFHISKNNHLITRLRTFLSYLSASVGCLKRYVEPTPKCKSKYSFLKFLPRVQS